MKHHADAQAHFHRVDVAAVQVLPAVENLALLADVVDEVVHAVERAQERALAAAGRADDRGDFIFIDGQVHGANRRLPVVRDGDLAGLEHLAAGVDRGLGVDAVLCYVVGHGWA